VAVGVRGGSTKKKRLLLDKIKFEPIFFTGSLAVFIQKGRLRAGGRRGHGEEFRPPVKNFP